MTPCGNPLEKAGNRYRAEKGPIVLLQCTFLYVMVHLKNMDATKNTVAEFKV